MKATVVDQRDVERDYGFKGVEAIVDHPTHGRLYVRHGFGGMDTLEGGQVRWKHGLAIQLRQNDTFADLDADWNDQGVDVRQAMTNGYDASRPVLQWDGYMVANLAAACGL